MYHSLHSWRGNYRLKLITSYTSELGVGRRASRLQHFAIIKAIGYVVCTSKV